MSSPLPPHPTPAATKDMLIGALLRVPAQAIQRRIMQELTAAGFAGLNLAHMAVLQFPGPEGVRPGELAQRAGVSKQAMNRLLGTLEEGGYLVRTAASGAGRARVVRFTRRGQAAYAKILDILRIIEREWRQELGSGDFAQLKALLGRVWESRHGLSLPGASPPPPPAGAAPLGQRGRPGRRRPASPRSLQE